MREFKVEDFEGSGQYLIRNDKEPGKYVDAGFMSTVMYKIGYLHGTKPSGRDTQRSCMVSMADGWTYDGYFITKHPDGSKIEDSSNWIWVPFDSKEKLVEYLNNPEHSQEYRFATQEEVVRVVMYQKHRWKNI